jgi:hypothetical protein
MSKAYSRTSTALTICGQREPIHQGELHAHWRDAAAAKGFELIARVADRFHLALRCTTCNGLIKAKLFVVMNNQPSCRHCLERTRRAKAKTAGARYLQRDPKNRHYALYRAPCGHDLLRQINRVKLISAAPKQDKRLRCGACQAATEAQEAKLRGWVLLGADPQGSVHYRHYRHVACGHLQRIARANMQTGRFNCDHCGQCWTTAKSAIYLMQFTLQDGEVVVKLGYSNDPQSRMDHQLKSAPDQPRTLLRRVEMPTGRAAIRAEKALHQRLKAQAPQSLIPPARFRGQIRVKSEIYHISMLPLIQQMLDEVEAQL